MIAIRAYAKINLTLEVLGRRPDGFHEVRGYAHALRLHDSLTLERSDRWEVRMEGGSVAEQDNLITRAGRCLEEAVGLSLPTRVHCTKRIPLAAGLGGGSADAAATLLGLQALWGLPRDAVQLSQVAARVGSDVPFLLHGGAALLEGRGERLEPAPPLPPYWVVVLVPAWTAENKTASMYARLRTEDFSDGQRTDAFLRSLELGAEAAARARWNVFERAAEEAFPGLPVLRQRANEASGLDFRLSGAGPALYALTPDRSVAKRALHALQPLEAATFLTRTHQGGPRPRVVEDPA